MSPQGRSWWLLVALLALAAPLYSDATLQAPSVPAGRPTTPGEAANSIHSNCTDPDKAFLAAQCPRVVRAGLCTRRAFKRICCRSCAEAEQLPSSPHELQGVYIHPNCTDPDKPFFFFNCESIVRSQSCAQFATHCCRACTEAGQLPSRRPASTDRAERDQDTGASTQTTAEPSSGSSASVGRVVGAEAAARLRPWSRVMRAQDGIQDGTPGIEGCVVSAVANSGWVWVRWDNAKGNAHSRYRMGAEGKYDLDLLEGDELPSAGADPRCFPMQAAALNARTGQKTNA